MNEEVWRIVTNKWSKELSKGAAKSENRIYGHCECTQSKHW